MNNNTVSEEYYLDKLHQAQKALTESFPEERLLKRKEAARMLSINFNTLKKWASTGEYNLPFQKIGRSVRYRYSDLLKFMERRTIYTTKEIGTLK